MQLPLIEDLLAEPLLAGSSVLVEYDATSQWYNASLTIAAGFLREGGRVLFGAAAQSPDTVRTKLNRLGLDVETLEHNNKLQIWDWYTCQLGQKSSEKYAHNSLKAADLSLGLSKVLKGITSVPEGLRILDDTSCLARFNDDKSWVEYVIARSVPSAAKWKTTVIRGIMRGVHAEWVYRQLEAAHEGVIDFILEETDEEPTNLMRIRTMRSVAYDGRWHDLVVGTNFDVMIQKAPEQEAKLERPLKAPTASRRKTKARRMRVYVSAV